MPLKAKIRLQTGLSLLDFSKSNFGHSIRFFFFFFFATCHVSRVSRRDSTSTVQLLRPRDNEQNNAVLLNGLETAQTFAADFLPLDAVNTSCAELFCSAHLQLKHVITLPGSLICETLLQKAFKLFLLRHCRQSLDSTVRLHPPGGWPLPGPTRLAASPVRCCSKLPK